MSKEILTQERLKELLNYNPCTGLFTRMIGRNRYRKGSIAGSLHHTGYILIMVDCKIYFAHRLVFLYMTGRFPTDKCDHINHIRDDNRWSNLREATNSENNRNASMRIDNKSGVTGVNWHKSSNKWVAQIMANNEKIHLGVFKNKNDAIIARKAAEEQYGFHANHGR